MGLETKSKRIGRCEYQVTQLGFKAGRAAMVRLTKVLGPIFGRLLDGSDGKSVSAQGVAGALYELSERLSEDDLSYLCELFGDKTIAVMDDGRRPSLVPKFMEEHFAGHYGEMIKWLVFCLEVNYGDFIADFGALSGVVLRKTEAAA
jgi:hypothetical protein